jgi:hypothetical protein
MSTRTLLLAGGVVLASMAAHTDAVGESSSAMIAHYYAPTAWSMEGGVLKNSSFSADKSVFIPLDSPARAPYQWCARVVVGAEAGYSTANFTCRLLVTADSGVNHGTCGETGTAFIYPNASGIILMHAGATYCQGAYVECSMPARTWMGNVRWNPNYTGRPSDCTG